MSFWKRAKRVHLIYSKAFDCWQVFNLYGEMLVQFKTYKAITNYIKTKGLKVCKTTVCL